MNATLQVIGSSSAANGYILSADDEKLIIEAGCKPNEYLNALNYDITLVAGIIATHRHVDHSRNIYALSKYGLQTYSSADVASIYPKCKIIEPMTKYRIGAFQVMGLPVPHGDCPNLAYWIKLPDGQTLLFGTDLTDFPYKIKGINHLMLECNYCEETVLDNLCNGADINSRPDNHLSLEKALEATRRLYSPKLSKVILLHLSDGNSNENLIKRRFNEELGIDVLIAESGLTVDLKEDDF